MDWCKSSAKKNKPIIEIIENNINDFRILLQFIPQMCFLCPDSYTLLFFLLLIFLFLFNFSIARWKSTNFGRNKKRVATHTILASKKGEIKNQETKSNRFKHCCTNEHCIHLFILYVKQRIIYIYKRTNTEETANTHWLCSAVMFFQLCN